MLLGNKMGLRKRNQSRLVPYYISGSLDCVVYTSQQVLMLVDRSVEILRQQDTRVLYRTLDGRFRVV